MSARGVAVSTRVVAVFVGVLLAAWLAPVRASAGVTFVVDRTGDAPDLNTGDDACDVSTNAGLQCTLRAAIQQANATAGKDTITFAIGGRTGVKVISPGSPLPTITRAVTIDGYTQAGASPNTLATGNDAVLKIQLSGANAGTSANGLTIEADNSTIRGLVINQFQGTNLGSNVLDGHGIQVTGSNNVIRGNFIGTNAAGNLDRGNTNGGVSIQGSDNTAGGTTPAARNLISGNGNPETNDGGIRILGEGETGNVVRGNYVGTNRAGDAALPNERYGMIVLDALVTVGGTSAGARNVVSGNGEEGVFIGGTDGIVVAGNFIGTDASGTADLGNSGDGVGLRGTIHATIGGTLPGARNIISGNSGSGILLQGAITDENLIQGNFIGTDATGMVALGNDFDGVSIFAGASGNAVGGAEAGARNVISGNANGVRIAGTGANDNSVLGNRLGTKGDGTGDLGNTGSGVLLEASDNLVGGVAAGSGNLIAFNDGAGVDLASTIGNLNVVQGNVITQSGADGVRIVGDGNTVASNQIVTNGDNGVEVSATGQGNRLLSNQLIANAALGIDLAGGTEDGAGVTANDNDDHDTGANDLQNFPVLTSALRATNGVTTVSGSLNSTPNREFTIQFFLAETEPSNHGEAVFLLGATTATTNSGGDGSFSFSTAALSPGQEVTATATNTTTGDTSEFSLNAVVLQLP